MNRSLPFLIIVVVLALAVAGTWVVLRSSKQAGTTNNAPEPSPGAEPSGAEPPHVRGNPNAPVTLEEFADFQCASCGYYYPELKKIEAEFGDRLRVIFRERPLVPPHEHALVAAQAAEAAGLQGEAHFWEMHDKLYEEQKVWSEARDITPLFVDYAKQIRLDYDRLIRVLSGEICSARIYLVDQRSHAYNVNITLTILDNIDNSTT